MHDLFQESFSYSVEEINANDSREFLIQFKKKWYDIALHEYKRQYSGTPPINFIFKSVFRNFPMVRTFADVPFRVLIIKDADDFSMDIQQALRRTMEKSSRTCRFCLICENLSKIIDPIRSRCVIFHFTPLKQSEIGAILRYIATAEKVVIEDDALLAIIHLGKGNLIRTINFLQTVAAVFDGEKIDADSVHQIANQIITYKVKEMIEFALNKEFSIARKKLRELFIQHGLMGTNIVEQIRNISIQLPIPADWKASIIDLLGTFELRMRKGNDEEIHLSAFLAQLGVLKLS